MANLLLLILLAVPTKASYSSYYHYMSPCEAKCKYEDSTTTPCWDPNAPTYSYGYYLNDENCLCCPSGSKCLINDTTSYYYGNPTITLNPVSCSCISDAECQKSEGNVCATCVNGECTIPEGLVDSNKDHPIPCSDAQPCQELMGGCATCDGGICHDYTCTGETGCLGVCDSCPSSNKCTDDSQCSSRYVPRNCAACAPDGRCYSLRCADSSCRAKDGNCPGSSSSSSSTASATGGGLVSPASSPSILEVLLNPSSGTKRNKGVLSVLGVA